VRVAARLPERFFYLAKGGDVGLGGGEVGAHGADADVAGAEALPGLELLADAVEVAIAVTDTAFQPELGRIAAGLLSVGANLGPRFLRVRPGGTDEHPAIGDAADASQHGLGRVG